MDLMFRVMVLRGCRRAELCGFRWSFADLDRGVLTVKRTVLQLGGKLYEEATAKSKAGDRLVFLDHDTAELLREHCKAQIKARMAAGPAWQDNDLIFCQADGGRGTPITCPGGSRSWPRRQACPSSSCTRAAGTPATR
jgi:integrase